MPLIEPLPVDAKVHTDGHVSPPWVSWLNVLRAEVSDDLPPVPVDARVVDDDGNVDPSWLVWLNQLPAALAPLPVPPVPADVPLVSTDGAVDSTWVSWLNRYAFLLSARTMTGDASNILAGGRFAMRGETDLMAPAPVRLAPFGRVDQQGDADIVTGTDARLRPQGRVEMRGAAAIVVPVVDIAFAPAGRFDVRGAAVFGVGRRFRLGESRLGGPDVLGTGVPDIAFAPAGQMAMRGAGVVTSVPAVLFAPAGQFAMRGAGSVTSALPALTGAFVNPPASHTGAAFTVRVLFSTALSNGFASVRDDGFDVANGQVTRVRRVDGRSDLWELTVTPTGALDVTITSTASLRAADGRTVERSSPWTVVSIANVAFAPARVGWRMRGAADITAIVGVAFVPGRPVRHAGRRASHEHSSGTVRCPSGRVDRARRRGRHERARGAARAGRSSSIMRGAADLMAPAQRRGSRRPAGSTLRGAAVFGVGGRFRLGESRLGGLDVLGTGVPDIAFAPAGQFEQRGASVVTNVTAAPLAPSGRVAMRGAGSVTSAVPALTGAFVDPPASHTGAAFTVRALFSAALSNGFASVRDDGFDVTNGQVTHVRRVDGRSDLWELTVTPTGVLDVTIASTASLRAADGRTVEIFSVDIVAIANVAFVPQGRIAMRGASAVAAILDVTLVPAGQFDVRGAVVVTNVPAVLFAPVGQFDVRGAADLMAPAPVRLAPAGRFDVRGAVVVTNVPAALLAPAGQFAMRGAAAVTNVPAALFAPAGQFAMRGAGAVTSALPALTGAFVNPPASHTGAAFTVRALFSEALSNGFSSVRDDGFDVTNGQVTHVRRVDGRSDLWELTVTPTGVLDVTITSTASLRAADGRTVEIFSVDIVAIANVAFVPAGRMALRGAAPFTSIPAALLAPAGRVAMRGAAAVTAIVDAALAPSGRIAMRGDTAVSAIVDVALAPAGRMALRGAAAVTNVPAALFAPAGQFAMRGAGSVTSALPALTGAFVNPPASHTGAAFTVRALFSEALSNGFSSVRDDGFDVANGQVTHVRRVDGRSDLWELTVTPTGALDVTITSTASLRAADGRTVEIFSVDIVAIANVAFVPAGRMALRGAAPFTSIPAALLAPAGRVAMRGAAAVTAIVDAALAPSGRIAMRGDTAVSAIVDVALAPAGRMALRGAAAVTNVPAALFAPAGQFAMRGAGSVTSALPALTGAFVNPPASHTGAAFTVRALFSEALSNGFSSVRDDGFDVANGRPGHASTWRTLPCAASTGVATCGN